MTVDAATRRYYAEDVYFHAQSWQPDAPCPHHPHLVDAFATVPREAFLPPGPWLIKNWQSQNVWFPTPSANPRCVHHDVAVALDGLGERSNGMPSQYAFFLRHLGVMRGEHALHIGAGTGYYSAILAELVGPAGRVTAVESDPALGAKSCEALTAWPHARCIVANGAHFALTPGSIDAILISAGVTHLLEAWVAALAVGGRLLVPMTAGEPWGGRMLLITREGEAAYAARFLCRAQFFDFDGMRNADNEHRLADALAYDLGESVRSLRRDHHAEEATCWLHDEGWCLSANDPARQGANPTSHCSTGCKPGRCESRAPYTLKPFP